MPFTRREFRIYLCVLFGIFIHFFFAVSVGGVVDYIYSGALLRFTLSFLLLTIILWSVFQLERYFSALDQTKFAQMVDTIYWSFVGLAILSLPFHFFDWVDRKQMLIFSEPSHFSVVFGPFFIYKMLSSSHRFKHLFLCLIIAFALKSVTLIAFALMGSLVSEKRYGILQILGAICFIGALVSFVLYFSDFFAFILDRALLSADSQNLSVLVFLSGYERAYLTMSESYLLGVGFQQMGIIGPLGQFQEAIMRLTDGFTMNKLDGGSLFSKLTTEFGIFGIFVTLAYILKAIRIFIVSRELSTYYSRELFYSASFLSLFILIFIRSVNYFSPSCILFVIALIGLSKVTTLQTRLIKEPY